MVQFNLLPDVKIEYIKTRYRKRLLMAISGVVSVAFLLLFILLFINVHVTQKVHLGHLNDDIEKYSDEINAVNDVGGLLTIQNQLKSLPALHDDKVVSSRTIDYITKVTPNGVQLSNVSVDFSESKLTLKGTAQDSVAMNKYVDSLKYTEFKVNGSPKGGLDTDGNAFSNVVLTSFTLPGADNNRPEGRLTTFSIEASFNPAIYAIVDQDAGQKALPQVDLTIPSITSSVSESQKPTLFKEQPAQPAETTEDAQ
jgi:Tfp pilus assembly protein PilN